MISWTILHIRKRCLSKKSTRCLEKSGEFGHESLVGFLDKITKYLANNSPLFRQTIRDQIRHFFARHLKIDAGLIQCPSHNVASLVQNTFGTDAGLIQWHHQTVASFIQKYIGTYSCLIQWHPKNVASLIQNKLGFLLVSDL